MTDDYLEKMFQDKNTKNELSRRSDEAMLEKRRRFVAHYDSLRKWLADILFREIERFNSRQKNPTGKIECAHQLPGSQVITAHKGFFPAGELEVELDKDSETVICKYLLTRSKGEIAAPRILELNAAVDEHGNFHLHGKGHHIPTDAIVQEILEEYFKAII